MESLSYHVDCQASFDAMSGTIGTEPEGAMSDMSKVSVRLAQSEANISYSWYQGMQLARQENRLAGCPLSDLAVLIAVKRIVLL